MSGAKNCPETPRQRMIGMMYLVLTAMLALNVSSEILNGFTMVDNSLHKTIESSEARNRNLYDDFQAMNQKNPVKVKEWLDKANGVKQKSDETYKFIEDFKRKIIHLADKKEANDSAYVEQIKAKDNLDKAGEYGLVGGHGKELKQKINEYRDFLIKLSEGNPTKQQMYRTIFSTNDTHGRSWEDAMFEMMPVSAVVTILTKYQSDVRSSEAEIVQYLKGQTDLNDFRVNQLEAKVIPTSKYVIRGAKYSAEFVISAIDKTQVPEYFISGSKLRGNSYEVLCNKSGAFKYSGFIQIKGNDGNPLKIPLNGDYLVGDPSATLSNEDLNVVYRGIDNKFSISVPGVAAENVSVRASGATLNKVGGKYIIRPTQDGEINISVYAKIDGKDLAMGGGSYRVKYIPDPKSFLQYNDAGNIPRVIQDGVLTKRTLKSGVSVIASYGQDELIKANFTVTSFTMVTIFGSVNTTGSRLNSRMLSDIDKLEGGEILTLKNIKAVGPDGKQRSLGLIQVQI